jgi:hypothetical protein
LICRDALEARVARSIKEARTDKNQNNLGNDSDSFAFGINI